MNKEPNIQDVLMSIQDVRGDVQDVLEVISVFSKHMDQRFTNIETDVGVLKTDVGVLKTDVGVLKSSMVTKDFLEEKVADLRGDLVTLSRKGNRKFEAAIHELVLEGNLKPKAAKEILSLEPFPSLG